MNSQRTIRRAVVRRNSINTGNSVKDRIAKDQKQNSPLRKSTVMDHYSPYPYYFYNRLVFPVGTNRLIVNNPLTCGQSYLIKSLLIQYAEMFRDDITKHDGNWFNYEVNLELYKVENNRLLMNEPLPVETVSAIGMYGVQTSVSPSLADVAKSNFKQFDVPPVMPQKVFASSMRIGNAMALNEMVPSNGNIYLVISRTKRALAPAFPLLTPELPMVVDIIVKGVYVPNRELKQKAY